MSPFNNGAAVFRLPLDWMIEGAGFFSRGEGFQTAHAHKRYVVLESPGGTALACAFDNLVQVAAALLERQATK